MESMAIELNGIIKPNEVLATHDIGIVGYYADYFVLDLVGLVNPEVVKYNKDRRLPEYVEGANPDYLLIFPSWDHLHIFAHEYPERYELVKEYPGGRLRGESFRLYRVIER
jgi:hypothetical protein